ncbi:hypothetical protein N7447_009674 [Penicillium robsamsonii]|uniref:uncharacterized protein n=1 Tax=Penicillium robsamsonii TaxID=1792511 RepID=UPI002546DB02|nr:uncharacterized protein N7447_009674 [Penicillium robsamsonii]KAJ5817441.1 hypothetical protein N7447_009674 [Penicillium robsamsonii]
MSRSPPPSLSSMLRIPLALRRTGTQRPTTDETYISWRHHSPSNEPVTWYDTRVTRVYALRYSNGNARTRGAP